MAGVCYSKHDNDLGAAALEVTNQLLMDEVYNCISKSASYLFMMGEKHTKRIKIDIGERERAITLREVWKSRTILFKHLTPERLETYGNDSLAIYRRDEDEDGYSFTVLMTHIDSTLIWKSKRHYVTTEPEKNSIKYYLDQKCDVLLHYNCPSEYLNLVQILPIEEFTERHIANDAADKEKCELLGFEYVILYEEAGKPIRFTGFRDDDDFYQAVSVIVDFIGD
ncbi:MAG: hypothetical protein HOD92_25945 [Deltaproteobacteria bacterium]|nr:hypothetical protein [Deltaproteobacteria bacterium]MBT4526512.1 hypothetical protein [Deltaproteobacteria bacterium]